MAVFEYEVKMSCSGCSGAVTRVLQKLDGVKTFNVDLSAQKVVVETDLPQEKVFETISKTGKATTFKAQLS